MRAGHAAEDLTIGQVAVQAGVRVDTVRYYEHAGLLPAPARTTGDHRRYGPATLDRLLFIRGAQRLGLRLAEIRELLAVRDTGVCACEPAETLLRRRVADIDAEMARMTALRTELTRMLERMPGPDCPDPVPGTWCLPGRADEKRRLTRGVAGSAPPACSPPPCTLPRPHAGRAAAMCLPGLAP